MPKFSDSPYFLLKDYFDILSKPFDNQLKEVNIEPYILWEGVNFCDWETSIISASCEYKTFTDTISDPNKDGVEWENWSSLIKWNCWYEPYVEFLKDTMLGVPNRIIVSGGNFVDFYVRDVFDSFKLIRLKPIFIEPEEKVFFQFIDLEKQKTTPGDSVIDTFSGPGFEFNEYNLLKETDFFLSDHIGQEVYFRKDSPFYHWLKESAYSYYLNKWETELVIRNYVNTDKNFIYFGELYLSKKEEKGRPLCYIKFEGIKNFVNRSIPSHQRTDNLIEFLDIYFDRLYNEVYSLQKNLFTLYDPMEVDQKYLNYIANQYYIDLEIDIGDFDNQIQRSFVKNLPFLLKKKGTYTIIRILWKVMSNTPNWIDIYDRWHNSSLTGQISANDYVDISSLNKYTNGIDTTDLSLSTSYKVELNLDIKPLETDNIITKHFCDILYNSMELVRPINRVASYFFSISPKTDIMNEWSSLYSDYDDRNHMLSTFRASSESFTEGAWIYIQNDSQTEWTVEHGLNTKNLLVKVIGFDGNEKVPKDIEIIDHNNIKLYFANRGRGIVLLKKTDKAIRNELQTETWSITHNLVNKEVLLQFKQKDGKWYYPKDVTLLDDSNLEVTESGDVEVGRISMLMAPDYSIQIQPEPEKIWIITHNLDKKGVIAQFYNNDNKLISPDYYNIIDGNTIKVEFEVPIMGYSVVESIGNYIIDEDLIPGNIYTKIGVNENSMLSDGIIYQETLYDIEENNGIYYITIILPKGLEGNIREIGIFELENDILISYTKCYPLYKHKKFEMKINYQIEI